MVKENPVILEMRSIRKTFGPVVALDRVDLRVEKGAVHAICGENGAGKSTLMKVLSGVYPAGTYEGAIVLDGSEVEFKSIRDSEKAGIAIIHQELALAPNLSILENIYLGRAKTKRVGIDWQPMRQEATRLLAKVGLDENIDTLVGNLGVGKQQLVEIARALSKDVRILILDEPTAALNDDDSEQLLELVRQLRAEGVGCVIISHKLNEVAEIADSVTIIRDGLTVETFHVREEGSIDEERIIRGMVGRSLDNRYPDHEPKIGDELLRVENWTVQHPTIPERLVSKGISLEVKRGEIVGIAGLMGSGRTEFAMSLFGRSYGTYQEGGVYKDGQVVDTSSVRRAIDNGFAYVSEDRKELGLNLIQSIRTNISSASLKKLTRHAMIDTNEEMLVAERYRASVRIKTKDTGEAVGNLSGGNQQKVALAKWLYTDPEILILDEPTRGIDVGAKYEIYELINALADEGKAVVVISSEMPELIGICDRIYALHEGSVTGQLGRSEFSQEALMRLMTNQKAGVAA
ncbi:ABC transporter ATP-binding protein [Mycobacteroides abscessus subsp. abscessus]|nr:ABC transporter ATP-binding protein [Mycobacteroides abscessus subsp. abscessus]